MNNHQAPHFDTFFHVLDRLGMQFKLKVYFTCPCSSSCQSACAEQGKFSFVLLKTQTSQININESSTSHFAKNHVT